MNFTNTNEEWTPFQAKVFSRWTSNLLKQTPKFQISDITKDLTNGISLINLANILTQKQTTKEWIRSPKENTDMVQNCDLALDMFSKDGVNLTGISGKEINENNENCILGLIWSLILHYSIEKSISSDSLKDNEYKNNNSTKSIKNNKEALVSWAIDQVSNYPNINNFEPYDLSICALLDSFVPEKINYYSLNPKDTKGNVKLANRIMKNLGIPVYIYPEDVTKNKEQIDEKVLLTQLSAIKNVLDSQYEDHEEEEDTNAIQKVDIGIEQEIEKFDIGTEKTDFELEDKIDNLTKAKEIADSEIDRLTHELETSESNNKELTQQISDITESSTKQIDAFKSDVCHLNEVIESLNKEKDELQKREIELNKTIEEIQQKDQFELENTRNYGTEAERIARGLSESLRKLDKEPTDSIESEELKNILLQIQIDKLNDELKQANEKIEQQKETIQQNEFHIDSLTYSYNTTQKELKIIQQKEIEAERIASKLSESLKQLQLEAKQKENLEQEKLNEALANINNLIESKDLSTEEINQLQFQLRKLQISESYEKKKREEAETQVDELEKELFKVNDESKRYKMAADKIISELSSDLDSMKKQFSKVMDLNKKHEETIGKQKEKLERSERDIIALTALLRDSKKEEYRNKEKFIEAERITKCLSESLKRLDRESKKRAKADAVAIQSALVDAQNEREAKESAQNDVERLSNELSKTVAEAETEKTSKEIALQNIDTLLVTLQNAFRTSEINCNKADEAERIARGLSESLKYLDKEYKIQSKEARETISKLSKEAEEERKAKEDATYELERLSNKINETEVIALHQKVQSDFEIDRLTGELGSLENDIQEFKEANQKAALKIQELHTALIKAETAARENRDKEVEATRIAEALSKSLKDLDVESKAQYESNSRELKQTVLIKENERLAKEDARNEIDRLTRQLNNIKTEFKEFKDANERAAIKIDELHTALIRAQKQAKINGEKEAEAERIAQELSASLKQLDEQNKSRSEADEISITHALMDAQQEREAKEKAQMEIQRLSASLNQYKIEVEQERKAKEVALHNIEILSFSLEKALKSAEINKNKAYEAERIASALTKSLKQLEKESKYRSEVDSVAISNALQDAQNEREAKETAQSDIRRLSSSLSKSEIEAAKEKHSKEIALHNVEILSSLLEDALKNANENRLKAFEAEKIAHSLSDSLKKIHQDFKEKEIKDEATIEELKQEAENERKAKEDASYEVERLTNQMTETEEQAEHQKNESSFEIDRLREEIQNLEENIESFKVCNERSAHKIEELHRSLVLAETEAADNSAKEAEATRIAEGLSKSLKEMNEESKTREAQLKEANSDKEAERKAKEEAQNEVDRLTIALSEANGEICIHKEAREKAELEIESLMRQFEELKIEFDKNEAIRFEAEQHSYEISKTLEEKFHNEE